VVAQDGRVDADGTARHRAELRQARLAVARPARRPVAAVAGDGGAESLPLALGVVQRGSVAYAEESGTPLAVAPDHWTDGCPVIGERRWADGPEIEVRTYLDPGSGRALHVEVALADAPRSFEVSPDRWTAAVTGAG